MKRGLLFIVLVVNIMLSGCSRGSELSIEKSSFWENQIPSLIIKYNNQYYPVDYLSDGWSLESEVTTGDAENRIGQNYINNIIKESEGSLTCELIFINQPDTITIDSWEASEIVDVTDLNETTANILVLQDNTITFPDDDESYIYKIEGSWEKGNVSYIFELVR